MATYRTTDNTKWGVGKLANLTAAEVDNNFWELHTRILTVEQNPVQPNNISAIEVVGTQMTVRMQDGSTHGPFTLPRAMIHYRGDWVAALNYNELDLVTVPGDAMYLVLRPHTSAAPFDAGAVNATGQPLYRALMPMQTPMAEAPVDGQLYGRKDAAWAVVPPGGGTNRGAWGGTTFWTFEDGAIPAAFTFDAVGASVVARNDPDEGESQALRFRDIIDGETTYFDVTVTADDNNRTLRTRYQTSSEASWDLFLIFVDSVEVHRASGIDTAWRDIAIDLADGSHTIRFQFQKDGTTSAGDDTVYIGSIRLLPEYDYGDVTTFLGSTWFNTAPSTALRPGAGTDWQEFGGAGSVAWVDVTGKPATIVGIPAAFGAAGQVLKVNTTADGFIFAADEGGTGSSTFIGLTDTPAAYGTAGQMLAINGTGDGLLFQNIPPADWPAITNKPATFPPSAHTHPWGDVTGRPATINAIPATLGAVGTAMRVAADGVTMEWFSPGAGVSTFLGLSDTPGAFGLAGQAVAINATGDGLIFKDFPAGGGGGGAAGATITRLFKGARRHFNSTPTGLNAWTVMPLAAAVIDTNAFANASNGYTIPTGVSRVRVRAKIAQSTDAATPNNQWVIYKNGAILTEANGGFRAEVDPDGFTNGGVTPITATIDVIAGDTLDLRHYLAAGAIAWIGWLEIEAIEGSILDQSVIGEAPVDGTPYSRQDGAWIAAGAGGAATFLELSDTPAAYGTAGQMIVLNGTANGFVFQNIPPADWPAITNKPATFPPSAHTHPWADVTGRPATINAIPATLGAAGTAMRVDAAGTGMEWFTPGAGVSTFIGLSDTPGAFGTAGQAVAINATGDGLIFKDFPAGDAAAPDVTHETTATVAISGSAYATKGVIYTVATDLVLRSVNIYIDADAAATYKAVVAAVSGDTAVIDEILANTASQAAPTAGYYAFDFPDVFVRGGQMIAVMLVRTDGTATAVAEPSFPTELGASNSDLEYFGSVRYASINPVVGDATFFANNSVIRVTFTYAPDFRDAPDDGKLYGRKNEMWEAIELPLPANTFRYWRLRMISEDQMSGTNAVYLGEMQFRETAGVDQQATGGAAFGNWASPALLFDGVKGTGTQTGTPYTDKVVGYDFGIPKTIEQVALYSENNLEQHAPSRFVIEGSNDNVTYTELLRADPIDPAWGTALGTIERLLAIPVPPANVTEAPADGQRYARKDAAWLPFDKAMPFTNKIINGDFDIWQRGTSFSSGSQYFGPDRWKITPGTGSVVATARDGLAPGTAAIPGNPSYGVKFDRTTNGTGAGYVQHRIESARTLSGKKVTLTFYTYSSGPATLPIYLIQRMGTGGTPSADALTRLTDIVMAGTTFEKQQFVVTLPSLSGKVLGSNNNDSLELYIEWPTDQLGLGSFRLYHVSVVEGDASAEADPFPSRHIEQELALCQRYYEKSYSLETAPGTVTDIGSHLAIYSGVSLTAVSFDLRFATQKRASPVMTAWNPASGGTGTWYDTVRGANIQGNLQQVSSHGCWAYVSGMTAADVNLRAHWTADAEL